MLNKIMICIKNGNRKYLFTFHTATGFPSELMLLNTIYIDLVRNKGKIKS